MTEHKVAALDEPLLAHWQFGLGKATAFTSDCKSRWSALWLVQWAGGYNQFWSQVLREMARPPQGRHMDLRLIDRGHETEIVVDLMADAATFKHEADVSAQVFHVAANALGSGLQKRSTLQLEQRGPGRYTVRFRPDEPGVYLVRSRAGADTVSAGLVRNISGEAATGEVDRKLLADVCRITGGRLIESDQQQLILSDKARARLIELRPWLLIAALALFVADIVIRRWENVLGMAEMLHLRRAN